MAKEKLILIGNGMAGVRTLEELLKIAPDRYDITVFGAEPHGNYNRIMLSPVLAGELQIKDIILNDFAWYEAHGITLHAGHTVTRIDREAREVHTASGICESYDRLLIATGSQAFILPVPGKDLPGVVSYRDIADTQAMLEAAESRRHAIVIGAGLLGLEAANGLLLRGMDVTVVHLAEWIMERQLDRVAANMLQSSLEKKGMRFLLAHQTDEIKPGPDGHVGAISFKNGNEIPADLVVMAAGIRPNVTLAEAAGLACNRGIVVDDALCTNDPAISAVGECVNHRGTVYGLVAPLFEQAAVCAAHLAGPSEAAYTGSVTATKLKVTGIDVFSAGDFMGGEDYEEIVLHDRVSHIYKKLVLKDGRLHGAVLYGDTSDGGWYFQLLKEESKLHALRNHLMFGQTHVRAYFGDPAPASTPQAEVEDERPASCQCGGRGCQNRVENQSPA